jgi:hypothetical protein
VARRQTWLVLLAACVVAAAVFGLFASVLPRALIGDDYQWVQFARQARQAPWLLLADLDTYYRPTTTWTLVADELVWGGSARGFRAGSLLLHALAGVLLLAAARRLGLGTPGATALALLWACSPFAAEPAMQVAIRFESLLLIAWAGLILAWPRGDERWTPARATAVVALTVLAALSKETWVVTPGLMVALELGHRPAQRWRSRGVVGFAVAAVLAYVVAYFLVFPGTKGYGTPDPAVLWKVPEQMAAFLFLRPPAPVGFGPSVLGALALAVSVAVVLAAIAWRPALGWTGAALLLAPMLPTLLVPYLPLRYSALPYAGFLLAAAGALQGLGTRLARPVARVATLALTLLLALVLAAQVAVVKAEQRDLERIAAWHQLLLDEAAQAAPALPVGESVVVARAEADNPLKDIGLSPQGWPKLLYVRAADPYGLIDAAALLDWCLAPRGLAVADVVRGDAPPPAGPGRLLIHRHGGFEWREPTSDLRTTVTTLRARGVPVKVIAAVRR